MKILTVISQSLDAEEMVRVSNDRVDLSSSKLTLDKMDEYGVEEALRQRESGLDCEIIAVGVGGDDLQSALREALALGADSAIHIKGDASSDVLDIGRKLANVCRAEGAQLVFVGGQQGSLDTHALGPILAEYLDWPQVTWVNSLHWIDGRLKGRHDVDDGQVSFEIELPVVITTQQGLNEPRYPTVLNIRRGNQKELRQVPKAGDGEIMVRIIAQSVEMRPRLGIVLDGKDAEGAANKLVTFLRNEAKVIA